MPPALETASTALRDAAAPIYLGAGAIQRHFRRPASPQFEQRLAAIGQQLAVQRDNLARVSVITDRQVAVVVPQAGSAQSATYGNPRRARARRARWRESIVRQAEFLARSLPVLRRRGYPVPGDLQLWRAAGQFQLE